MSTYIVIHNPNVPNVPDVLEKPAQEIAENIRAGKRATTAFGGWSIGTNQRNIKPGDRLLFYRSEVAPKGFFAVGRALCADNRECRELREAQLRKWYPKSVVELGDAIGPGLAAYKATGWDTGKDETFHINAEWDVVADPNKHKRLILDPCESGEFGVVRASGFRVPDDKLALADAVCERCRNSANALHAPQTGKANSNGDAPTR